MLPAPAELLGEEPGAVTPPASALPKLPADPLVRVASSDGYAAPDFTKIDKNIAVMRSQGAPDEHIDQYLKEMRVTPEQMIAAKKTTLSKIGDAVSSAAGAVVGGVKRAGAAIAEAYEGKVDPQYKDVPGFNMDGIDPKNTDFNFKILAAKTFAPEDSAYGEIIKKTLGTRLKRVDKDMHGQEIITYAGDDGGERRAYVNKPGLDYEDIDRTIGQALPFIGGGAAVGAVVKGTGMAIRAGAQALTGGAISVAGDLEAGKLGSTEGVDLPRAGMAAGGGALGEVLTPVVSAAWRKLVAKPAMIDPGTGKLSAVGQKYAAEIGLTPEQIAGMEGQTAKNFAEAGSKAVDPDEVASAFRTGEFGISTTKGQRTKSPQLLQMEVEMRRGLWGQRAQDIMTEFDKTQKREIGEAVDIKIGKALAPHQTVKEKASLGGSIQDGMRAARAYMDEAEGQFWGAAGPMFPDDKGLPLLKGAINKQLRDNHVMPSPNLGRDPMSNEMLQFLENWTTGKVDEKVLPLLGGRHKDIWLDDVRRKLLEMYRGAEPGTYDAKAAKHIYDGFNNWIGDLSDKALLVGRPDAAASLTSARGFTRDMKQLFSPTDNAGKLTAAGKRLETIFKKADSPESVVDAIVPNPGSKLRVGDVDTLKHMKEILIENGARETWDDVRLAYWVKLAHNEKGEILSPTLLKNRIDAAFANQQSALNQLYGREEQHLFKRFAESLGDATWVDPNPSGTSYNLAEMVKRFDGKGILKTMLQTQSQREMFSKHNVLASRIYRILAMKVPGSLVGSKEGAGAAGAAIQIKQGVTIAPHPSTGLGAAVGSELGDD